MTLKEFMHTPNPSLDNLTREAESQRTADEEAFWETRAKEKQEADAAYTKLITRYPKGICDAVYADAIIDLIGVKAMDLLIKYHKIETCGILEGRKLYAI